jgi:integrase
LAKLKALGVHPDFPLFPHQVGQWAKKVRGELKYFGPLSDPDAALAKWLEEKDDLLAGRAPRPKAEGIQVRDLVNHFLTAKRQLMESGDLASRTFQDYYDTCLRVADAFGKARPVADLRPEDFDALRAKTAAKLGPVALGNEIQRVRSLFKYGFDVGILETPVRFGPHFRKPKRREVRLARAAAAPRFFAAAEILALLAAARPQMKAMILLGINCGWGNSDVAELQTRHLDLKAGLADYPRPKTGIGRRAPLWPETVDALRKALKARPEPKVEEDRECVFLTKYGARWKRAALVEKPAADGEPVGVRRSETDSVGLEFGKLLRAVKVRSGRAKVPLKRAGVNFYALRHTFETIAGETGDQAAVDRIMGHEDGDAIATTYREWIKDAREDERLRRVTTHVRDWLYGQPAKTEVRP